MKINRSSRAFRSTLLASAGVCLVLAAAPAAQAQSTRPSDVVDSAQSNAGAITVIDSPQSISPVSAAQTSVVAPGDVVDSPQIAINNNFTPTDARDPTNITGVGQLVTDAGGGSVGLCTATLINPRTVLYAAHCVNNSAATAYGAGSGGTGVAVGFETNTRANGAGQVDELVAWLFGGGGGPGQFKTNTAQALYNISQVFYNPLSISATSCTGPTSCFLEADVATAVLDTPTRNIPTWALLFSPLSTPGSINTATGTGYHVVIDGYGRNGNGTTGTVGNDFRRRVAENMLGALTSINDRNLFLFGTTGAPSRPQVLYWMDFDDPARGTAGASAVDFNGFRDNALTREGITGPGDSGGPLILDRTFSKAVVIGTLSGGSTFNLGGGLVQVQGGYGTQSFYQPLFLYWDWIVANNPYHYVTAVAGNKNWEDATAWVTELDPMYNILSGGQLVNGLPTNLGGGTTANAPQFGEFCFQSPNTSTNPAFNECQNTDGTVRNNVPNGDQAPTGGVQTEQLTENGGGAVSTGVQSNAIAGRIADGGVTDSAITGISGIGSVIDSAQADPGFSNTPRPAATLTNGLPGATNFTPNNVDGVRTTGQIGKYFDVTLRNTGVVTLNSTVTVDRFAIAGATAQLNVATGAKLTSLIEINQLTGTVVNNGTISTPGDYFLMSGLLSGTGTVIAPFTTSVLGSIAPGTLTTTGTITFQGNLVLSSGNNLLINLGAPGVSDRVVVTGSASLGGTVTFSWDNTLRAGNTYTILTANSLTGTFNTPAAISAILRPTLSYTPTAAPTAVQVAITAGTYASVLGTSGNAGAWAQILDQNRPGASHYDGLYGPLDLQSATTIQNTIAALAPTTETLIESLGTAAVDGAASFIRSRLASTGASSTGGTFARYGAPLQVASLDPLRRFGVAEVRSDSAPSMLQEGKLPESMSAYVAGGYLNGDSAPMSGMALGRDDFDGWYVAGGVEKMFGGNAVGGLAFSYTDLDGTGALPGNTAKGKLYQGTLYGKVSTKGGVTFDGQVSGGQFQTRTRRVVSFVGTPYTLTTSDTSMVLAGEVGVSTSYEANHVRVTPRAAARATYIDFDPTPEAGGPMALVFDRPNMTSIQGRLGVTVAGTGKIKPNVNLTYVHEFKDRPGSVGANLVGGIGPNALFLTNSKDPNYFEVGGGLTFTTGNVDLSVSAETSFERSELSNQTYRGSVTFHF